ncbi:MAG: PAS domain-containing protein [Solirubrobacteraceae bacterium]|nr:PAS domain-containing protein [Solirubrobacteraceae bacterium]
MKQSPRAGAEASQAAIYRQVFEQRFQFMAVLDTGGIVVEINAAPVRRGLSREDFLGRHIGATPSFSSDPQWVGTWDARLAEARDARYPVSYEDVYTGPRGETRSADAVLSPVLGTDAETVEYFVLEAEDTTERLQVELALRASERRFHDFAESLPLMAWSTDAAGECDFLNRRWLDYTGAAPGQHHGWNWIDAVHPQDRPGLGDLWTAALASGDPVHCEYRVRQYDDAYRWFDLRITPVLGDEGQVTRWYGAALDIHEAHGLRSALQQRESQLSAALEAGEMARFSFDLEHRSLTSDATFAKLLAGPDGPFPADGVEGFADHVHPDDRGAWLRDVRRAFDQDTPTFFIEFRVLAAQGRPARKLGARGRVTFDEFGKPCSIAGVVFVLAGGVLVDPRD